MADATTGRPRVLVLSEGWDGGDSETAFVARSLAGALSRRADVDLAVPRRTGVGPPVVPDGLFDAVAAGASGDPGPDGPGSRIVGAWAGPDDPVWAQFPEPDVVLVDPHDRPGRHLARARFPGAALLAAVPAGGSGDRGDGHGPDAPDLLLSLLETAPGAGVAPGPGPGVGPEPGGSPTASVPLYVPINPLSAERRHYGLGFTGYVLVLSDRAGEPVPDEPTPPLAWLTAAFPLLDFVVVEGGVANVWKGRARRGQISVSTRADLCRLVAHARTTVDLAPGELVARECVESMRFGVPVAAPSDSAGEWHGGHGGRTYRDLPGMIDAVGTLSDPLTAERSGAQARLAADRGHGHPDHFVEAAGAALVRALDLRRADG